VIPLEETRGQRAGLVGEQHDDVAEVNMHIDLQAQILAVAVDHGHIASNPAIGKRRRLKVSKARPVYLDSAEEIAIVLEAAGDFDPGDAVLGGSRSGATRPTPACARWTCCRSCGRSSPTLRVYSPTMRRSQEERERLKALVQGHVWAANGQREPAAHQPAHHTADS
jgi:hypothetical protein